MSWTSISNAVVKRFKEQIADTLGLVTEYPNGPELSPKSDQAWARVYVDETDSQQVDIGSAAPLFREQGALQVQLFYPMNKGAAAALATADVIKLAFRRQTVDGVTYITPTPRRVGRTAGGWYQINVRCPYYADEI